MLNSGARRRLGQNFLIDANIARKIVDCLQVSPKEGILEVGPGQGSLTGILLQRSSQVVALERDPHLAVGLKQRYPLLRVINADALCFDWSRMDGRLDRIVGNLPYNIASPLIWDLVCSVQHIKRAVFMVQKEVAQRLAADTCCKSYGGLSIWVQSFAKVRYEFEVSCNVFRPRPRVSSAVVSLEPLPRELRPIYPDNLSRLLKLFFQNRRKQVGRILKQSYGSYALQWLERHGLSYRSRPEEITPAKFESLSRDLRCIP